ncbi:hypothetical protein C8R45DRAFT_1192353 [Mycena sanguinolenta]|nr:hypothetical protein C8R45DRAFT_1192353 [Mycena sanguinolenta]
MYREKELSKSAVASELGQGHQESEEVELGMGQVVRAIFPADVAVRVYRPSDHVAPLPRRLFAVGMAVDYSMQTLGLIVGLLVDPVLLFLKVRALPTSLCNRIPQMHLGHTVLPAPRGNVDQDHVDVEALEMAVACALTGRKESTWNSISSHPSAPAPTPHLTLDVLDAVIRVHLAPPAPPRPLRLPSYAAADPLAFTYLIPHISRYFSLGLPVLLLLPTPYFTFVFDFALTFSRRPHPHRRPLPSTPTCACTSSLYSTSRAALVEAPCRARAFPVVPSPFSDSAPTAVPQSDARMSRVGLCLELYYTGCIPRMDVDSSCSPSAQFSVSERVLRGSTARRARMDGWMWDWMILAVVDWAREGKVGHNGRVETVRIPDAQCRCS